MTNTYLKRLVSLVVMMLMMLSSVTINADVSGTLDCTVSEFISDGTGEVYFTVSGAAKGSISVYVYAGNQKPTEFSATNMPVAFNQYDFKGGLNEFEYKIALPSELATGSYNIMVMAKDGSYKFVENYFYFNDVTAETAKDEINSAILKGTSDICEALSANAEALMLEDGELDIYGAFVSDLLYSRKDDDGKHIQFENATDLMKAYSEAKAIYNVENRGSDQTLEEAIAENASALNISLTADYQTALTSSAKAELYDLLKNDKSWKVRPYADMYKELAALASVKKASSWSALKSVVTDQYKDIIDIDTSKNKNILDDIFVEMITYRFDTFEDIRDNYDLAVKAVKKADSDGGSGSSSSGGKRPGGGSSGMTVVGNEITNMIGDTSTTTTAKFSDLPDNHWAATEINYLVANNVLTGYPDGTFGGAGYITRAEFATLLSKAFSLSGAAAIPFEDVSADKWYSDYVKICYSNGIINGTSATTFSPEATITREDACVMIYRVLSDVVTSGNGTADFADGSEISVYALDAINALYNAGLVNGVGDNKFAPKVCIDRQSAAKIIYDALMILK